MTQTASWELDHSLEGLLAERGYTRLEPIGEGQTRTAYKVLYERGLLRKIRVLKLPKKEIDPTSITTRINRTKGDLNEREVLTLNQIRHPHVVEIYDAIPLPNGEIATVEEWYDALSLEDLVHLRGPVSDDQFQTIFAQVLDGLAFLHGSECLYHRDIKPSNILVGRKDLFTKIADLQNAGKKRDIAQADLPTRGGTAYTHPLILNALLEGQPISCDLRSEFYALGATMYYALTGENLWSYSLVPKEGGRQIQLGEETITIALEDGEEYTTSYDLEQHDKIVRKKIKKLPSKKRKLVESLLLLDQQYPISSLIAEYAHERLRKEFDSATRKTRIDWRRVGQHTVWATVGAACLAGGIGGIGFLRWEDSVTVEPKLIDALRTVNFRDWDLSYLEHAVNGAMLKVLQPSFQEVAQHSQQLDAFYKAQHVTTQTVVDVAGVSNRLAFAVLESIILTPQDQIHDQYHAQRYDLSLVPKEFIRRWLGNSIASADGRGRFGDSISELQIIGGAMNYVKKCLIAEDTVSDVFACYFTDPGELARAQSSMQSSNYFPTLEVETRWVNGRYGEYDEKDLPVHNRWGYRVALPQVEQDLINRATALYLVMDNEGNLHPNLIADDGSIKQDVLEEKIP